jgi:hypothetical protein
MTAGSSAAAQQRYSTKWYTATVDRWHSCAGPIDSRPTGVILEASYQFGMPRNALPVAA